MIDRDRRTRRRSARVSRRRPRRSRPTPDGRAGAGPGAALRGRLAAPGARRSHAHVDRAVHARRVRRGRGRGDGPGGGRRGRGVRVHAVRHRHRVADRVARPAATSTVVAPTDATVGDAARAARRRSRAAAARFDVRALDPPGDVVAHVGAGRGPPPAHARRGAACSDRSGCSCARRRRSASSCARGRCASRLPAPIAVAPRPSVAPGGAAAACPTSACPGGVAARRARRRRHGARGAPVRRPAIRPGSCTGRRARGAARSSCASTSRRPRSASRSSSTCAARSAEAAASRAAGIGIATLAAGGVVWCGTFEDGEPVGEIVADARALGRRLARATSGAPAEPPRAVADGGGARVSRASAARGASAGRAPRRVAAGLPHRRDPGRDRARLGRRHRGRARATSRGSWARSAARSRPRSACSRCRRSRPAGPRSCCSASAGSAALRHASFAGADRSWLLVVWAAATHAHARPRRPRRRRDGARARRRRRAPEPDRRDAARRRDHRGWSVAVAAVALVPTRDRPARPARVARPRAEQRRDVVNAPSSLHSSGDLLAHDPAAPVRRGRVHRRRVPRRLLAGRDVRRLQRRDGGRGLELVEQLPDGSTSSAHDGTRGAGRARGLRRRRARPAGEFRQTFHIEAGFSDVVFAAPSPRIVETDKLLIRRPDGTLRVARRLDGSGLRQGRGLHRLQPQPAGDRGHAARGRHAAGAGRDHRSSTRRPPGTTHACAALAQPDHRRADDDVRQGPGHRELAGREHEVLAERAALAAERRRRRRLLVPQPRSAGASRSRAASSCWPAAPASRPGS